VDLPEPPTIVLEQPAPCADARTAEELLNRAMTSSKAPRGGWALRVHAEKAGLVLTVGGEIRDDAGIVVARRTLVKETSECGAMARALGVWASLVLDQEVARAATPVRSVSPGDSDVTSWPAPAEEDAGPRAASPPPRTIEVGAGGSYMYGALGDGGPAMGGAHVFMNIEIDGGWLLHPQVAVGRSLKDVATTPDLGATSAIARIDACRRMPGNYREHHGLQLDVCGGLEGGFIAVGALDTKATLPLLAPGAALAMRGDLGADLAAEMRGTVGVNMLRGHYDVAPNVTVEPLLIYARLELGVAWKFQ
jgi:hypothetical protein